MAEQNNVIDEVAEELAEVGENMKLVALALVPVAGKENFVTLEQPEQLHLQNKNGKKNKSYCNLNGCNKHLCHSYSRQNRPSLETLQQSRVYRAKAFTEVNARFVYCNSTRIKKNRISNISWCKSARPK